MGGSANLAAARQRPARPAVAVRVRKEPGRVLRVDQNQNVHVLEERDLVLGKVRYAVSAR